MIKNIPVFLKNSPARFPNIETSNRERIKKAKAKAIKDEQDRVKAEAEAARKKEEDEKKAKEEAARKEKDEAKRNKDRVKKQTKKARQKLENFCKVWIWMCFFIIKPWVSCFFF